MSNRKEDEHEKLRRAAGALEILKTTHETGPHAQPHPLRWGELATNGTGTFERMLHATAAALYHNEAIDKAQEGEILKAKSLAGQSSRHLTEAGDWAHDSAHMPYVFSEHFKHQNTALLNLLWVAERPDAHLSSPEKRTQTLGILHATAAMPAVQQVPALAEGVNRVIADHTFVGWGKTKSDPRPFAQATVLSEDERDKEAVSAMFCVAPYVTFHPENNPAPREVADFYNVNAQVYSADITRAAKQQAEVPNHLTSLRPDMHHKFTAKSLIQKPGEKLPSASPQVLGYT